jgi:hypothetical protein
MLENIIGKLGGGKNTLEHPRSDGRIFIAHAVVGSEAVA